MTYPDKLIFIYDSIDRIRFLKRVDVSQRILRFFIRIISNISLPLFFKFNNNKLCNSSEETNQVIVSLTTFPARINKVWLVIETLLNQSLKPDRIILWLSIEQFDGLDTLPSNLLKQMKRGLEIRFVEGDLRSHKKYYYALREFKESRVITVDDDIFYPSYLIRDLIELGETHISSILAFRGSKMTYYDTGNLKPYSDWVALSEEDICRPNEFFFTSGGGTLFPPNVFNDEVFNKEVFMTHCKYADDVWLNLMAKINKASIVKTRRSFTILPVFNKENVELSTMNLGDSLNDKQIKAVCDFYKKKGINIFS